MRKSIALPFAGLALASLLAAVGCSGNTNQAVVSTGTPTPVPTPSATCTPPAGYTIQEVFPQANGVNQPNLQGVVFDIGPSPQPGGIPSPLPTNWYFYVSSSLGSTGLTANIAFLGTPTPMPSTTALPSGSPAATPTPLPTPSDAPVPSFTNYIPEAATLGIFSVNTTFTVFLANTNCYPGIQYNKFTTNATDLPSPTPTPTATST